PRTRASKKGKPREVYGVENERATAELMAACKVMGFWSPDDHVRGLGAWVGTDGDLVLHRGDHVFVRGQMAPLGRRGEYVYVPRRPRPALRSGPGARAVIASAAAELLARLDLFHWSRGSYDANLCLGWIGCGMLGACLPFRPHLWIAGEFGAGKSTFHL